MTTFGGGKTHSLLAVYHAASGISADKLPGMRDVLDGLGLTELPAKVNRAVLVGNDLSVLGSTKPDGSVVNTMWGELAWQLGGPEGFAMIARYDAKSAPPPTTELATLLEKYSPCVILIDEWVGYLRQLWSRREDVPVWNNLSISTGPETCVSRGRAGARAKVILPSLRPAPRTVGFFPVWPD